MEPFRGGLEGWVAHLKEAGFLGLGAGVSDEERIQVMGALLSRLEGVRAELRRLPQDRPDVQSLRRSVEDTYQAWRS